MGECVPDNVPTACMAAPRSPLNVLIIGAGLGGLTTAIALRRQGHIVTIFEKSRLASEFGAAINVPPNATGILKHLGVDPVEAGAVEFKWFTEYNKAGDFHRSHDFTVRTKGWQHKYLLAHRVDLHNQLKDAATSPRGEGSPVALKTASEVVDVDVKNAIVSFKDGSTAQGDLSRTRAKLTDKKPFPSGHSAYRFMLRRADVLAIPEVADVVKKDGELMFWFDVSRRIVMYPTRDNQTLNFVCIHPDEGNIDQDDNWNQVGSVEALLKSYEGFDERARRMLGMADESTLKVWKLMDMEPVDHWCAERFCLVGDAAHPFLPHQGQGGAQAMEDGVSLGTLLPRGTDPTEIPSRLRLYQQCRKVRAEYVQEVTRQSGKNVASGSKDNAVKVMKFFDYNCGHDEYHHSIQQLRNWQYKEQAKVYWRMPVGFGPSPGPRQDAQGLLQPTGHSTTLTRRIRFKTSRTLLDNILPTPAYSFISPDTVAEASYGQTTLDKMDWLAGKGYDYFGFYIHGVQYTKKDGSVITGDYLAVIWENLTDPILSGREELGFPKLFCDIDVEQTDSDWSMKASWRGANFINLELRDLVSSKDVPLQSKEDGLLLYKYVPTTGRPGYADAEYPVLVPTSSEQSLTKARRTTNCNIAVDAHNPKILPTLHHIVSRLAELPIFEIVEGTVVEGTGVEDLRSAYRVE